jgi:deoxyribonuclease V
VIAILDAAYGDDRASVACVVARDWAAEHAEHEYAAITNAAASYASGQFYKRELPLLLDILGRVTAPISCAVVDGYVWLDANGAPGLGAHLHDALGRKVPVIGVAKTRYAGADAIEVLRGKSRVPFFVTATGIDAAVAASHIRAMHGAGRIPFLLRRADQLARSTLQNRE